MSDLAGREKRAQFRYPLLAVCGVAFRRERNLLPRIGLSPLVSSLLCKRACLCVYVCIRVRAVGN